jgi:hypothetical protein
MIYSVTLTMAADTVLFPLGVHQLAARILFEGVAVDLKNLKIVGVP